uniref:Uncharacterized protein n=1 Tax=Quercus lobata TaxID=97700 RepID=A0A7N2MIN3_QUELO
MTTSASNNNNNNNNNSSRRSRCYEEQPRNHRHHQLSNGKILRKRMASEIEIEVQTSTTCTAPDTKKNNDYIRFSRRAGSNTTVNGSSSSFQGAGNNNHVGSVDNFPAAAAIPNPCQTNNYSTMLPSSTTNLTSMTSGGGGFLSCVTPPNLSPAAQPQHQINTTPAAVSVSVCGFSGLPLFPSERSQNNSTSNNTTTNINGNSNSNSNRSSSSSRSLSNNNNTNKASVCGVSMEEGSAWIDGIIKDLIHSSNNVSIPQLIQNVREIIFPCNPNLAAVLEYRLRYGSQPEASRTVRRL